MEKPRHSIRFVEEKCVGCGTCLRACPTKAIRVVNSKARVNADRCIDCGECFRLCPHDAIVSETTSYADLEKFDCAIALPSPVLYSQFAHDVLPNQILLALKKIGFEYVADEAWDCELTTNALQEYLDTTWKSRENLLQKSFGKKLPRAGKYLRRKLAFFISRHARRR